MEYNPWEKLRLKGVKSCEIHEYHEFIPEFGANHQGTCVDLHFLSLYHNSGVDDQRDSLQKTHPFQSESSTKRSNYYN